LCILGLKRPFDLKKIEQPISFFQEINEDIETRNRVYRNCTDIPELTCEIPADHAVNKGKVSHFIYDL